MKCSCDSIGKRKTRVVVERPTYTQDSANEQQATWSTYTTQRGAVRAMTPREVVQAEQVQGALGWIVELPWNRTTLNITSDMRLKFTEGRAVTAFCDGPSMPVGTERRLVQVRAVEQTA